MRRGEEERGGDGDGRFCDGEGSEKTDCGNQGGQSASEAGFPRGDQAEQDFQGFATRPNGQIVGGPADEGTVWRARRRLAELSGGFGATTCGQDESLAGVDLAGIAESGIGAGNTLPFGAVAVVGEGDLPERITRMN